AGGEAEGGGSSGRLPAVARPGRGQGAAAAGGERAVLRFRPVRAGRRGTGGQRRGRLLPAGPRRAGEARPCGGMAAARSGGGAAGGGHATAGLAGDRLRRGGGRLPGGRAEEAGRVDPLGRVPRRGAGAATAQPRGGDAGAPAARADRQEREEEPRAVEAILGA